MLARAQSLVSRSPNLGLFTAKTLSTSNGVLAQISKQRHSEASSCHPLRCDPCHARQLHPLRKAEWYCSGGCRCEKQPHKDGSDNDQTIVGELPVTAAASRGKYNAHLDEPAPGCQLPRRSPCPEQHVRSSGGSQAVQARARATRGKHTSTFRKTVEA